MNHGIRNILYVYAYDHEQLMMVTVEEYLGTSDPVF